MNQNSIKETSDDLLIKNIKQASWFCTMEHYPKTVGHIKLLVSIVDKIGIFKKFDLAKTSDMEPNKLNILYAILRITNKVFNKYLDYVVRKIFRDGLKEIFSCKKLTYYDLFFDQLTQDLDHFVCYIIKTQYPQLIEQSTEQLVKNKMVDFFHSNFRKIFYQNIMKKLSYDVGDDFYKENDKLFQSMAQEFVLYTKETLTDTYDTMKIFLDKIFNPDCSDTMLDEIFSALKKHIDLETLFEENCMEIDIYCEQKLDDELEWSDRADSQSLAESHKGSDTIITKPPDEKKSEIDKINMLIKDIGYQIHNNNNFDLNNLSILQPFINHNFAKTEKELLDMLVNVITEYAHFTKIIDPNSNVTIENYYALAMAMIGPNISSHQDFCDFITENNHFPDIYPSDLVLRLVSRIYNIKIELLDDDLCIIEIDNTIRTVLDEPVIIYKKNNTYYTLCIIDCPFFPIYCKVKNPQLVLKEFKKSIRKKNSHLLDNLMTQYTFHKNTIEI